MLLGMKMTEEAFKEASKLNGEVGELILVRLMGRTGPCFSKLAQHSEKGLDIIERMTKKFIKMMKERAFLAVILPWITELTQLILHQNEEILDSCLVSDLIEAMIEVINDQTKGGSVDHKAKLEMMQIAENLSQAFNQ